ncbi:MAG TPA: hypothetical protein V6D48_05445 [Oculatellaceae cyanobacterium]
MRKHGALAKRGRQAQQQSAARLNRYEFERRYNAMPNLKKAELIEGIV